VGHLHESEGKKTCAAPQNLPFGRKQLRATGSHHGPFLFTEEPLRWWGGGKRSCATAPEIRFKKRKGSQIRKSHRGRLSRPGRARGGEERLSSTGEDEGKRQSNKYAYAGVQRRSGTLAPALCRGEAQKDMRRRKREARSSTDIQNHSTRPATGNWKR